MNNSGKRKKKKKYPATTQSAVPAHTSLPIRPARGSSAARWLGGTARWLCTPARIDAPAVIRPLITLIYRQRVSKAPGGLLRLFQEQSLKLGCFLVILVGRNWRFQAASSSCPAGKRCEGQPWLGGGWPAPGGLGARHTALVTYQVKDENIQCLS